MRIMKYYDESWWTLIFKQWKMLHVHPTKPLGKHLGSRTLATVLAASRPQLSLGIMWCTNQYSVSHPLRVLCWILHVPGGVILPETSTSIMPSLLPPWGWCQDGFSIVRYENTEPWHLKVLGILAKTSSNPNPIQPSIPQGSRHMVHDMALAMVNLSEISSVTPDLKTDHNESAESLRRSTQATGQRLARKVPLKASFPPLVIIGLPVYFRACKRHLASRLWGQPRLCDLLSWWLRSFNHGIPSCCFTGSFSSIG